MGIQMTQRALKWCIFAMLVLTVPVIFYVFMWIGVLPVAGIIAMSATAGDFLLAVVGLVHVALFGGMFYGIAVLISRACVQRSPGACAWGLPRSSELPLGCLPCNHGTT
jgi:hypothetical protein